MLWSSLGSTSSTLSNRILWPSIKLQRSLSIGLLQFNAISKETLQGSISFALKNMLTERGREGEKMSVFRSAKPNRIARIDYSKRYKIRPRINRAMFYANSLSLSNAMDLPSPGHLSHFENRGLNAEEIAYEQWHEIRITLCDHHALQRSLCSRPSFNEQPTPCITATLIIYFR